MMLRAASILCLLAFASSLAHAQSFFIRLSTFPTVNVADGRSQTTVTAEVRTPSGSVAPDGTLVTFSSTIGDIQNASTRTSNGLARAILVSPSLPGVAKITASVPGAAPQVLEFEFLADRKQLNAAYQVVRVTAPTPIEYDLTEKLLTVYTTDKQAKIKYGSIEVEADALQYNTQSYLLTAKGARLRAPGIDREFQSLSLNLLTMSGQAIGNYRRLIYNLIGFKGKGLSLFYVDENGTLGPAFERDSFGLLRINGRNITPETRAQATSVFDFQEPEEVLSAVTSKSVTLVPQREIQFVNANIYVGEQSVLKLPLFQIKFANQTSPIATEQFVSVEGGQLTLNYPYFLKLTPNLSQALRLRFGQGGDRTLSASQGLFLDYEVNWSSGEGNAGGFRYSGIGRDDNVIGFRQYLRIDPRSSVSAQLEIPAGRSLFGAVGAVKQFNGFQVNANGSANRSTRGTKFETRNLAAVIEKDPVRLPDRIGNAFFGVTFTDSFSLFQTRQNQLITLPDGSTENQTMLVDNLSKQQAYGLRARFQSNTYNLGPRTSISNSASITRQIGDQFIKPIAVSFATSIVSQISNSLNLQTNYEYQENGFTERSVGKHRISAQSYYAKGAFNGSVFLTKSLDLDRDSLFFDSSYRLSGTWRLAGGYTLDRNFGESFTDYNIAVGYRLGFRELGLVWSRQTSGLRVQFLGPAGF